MLGQVGTHGLAVGRAARVASHGVHEQARGLHRDADGGVEAHEHDDALGVHAGLLGAQALDAHLVELALAALLRALGAEHRACVHELRRLRALRHQVMLHHGAHDAGRALGPQRQAALRLDGAAVKERLQVLARDSGEHLLRHHVGGLADAAHEELRLLEQRRLDGQVAVAAEDVRGHGLEARPELRLVGKQVARAFGGLDCHGEFLFVSCVSIVRYCSASGDRARRRNLDARRCSKR